MRYGRFVSTLSRLWREASGGEKILVVLTALLLLIGVPVAIQAVQSSSDQASAGGGAPTGTTTSDGTSTTGGGGSGGAHPPVFLEELHPSGGDTPEIGDAELDGRSFRHSVFYEEIGEASRTGPCEEMSNCRATFYELGGGYETFTASFGLFAYGSSAAGFLPTAEWRVGVDGRVLDRGHVEANEPPEAVSVETSGGQVLELQVNVSEPGIGESNTAVWGNAHLR